MFSFTFRNEYQFGLGWAVIDSPYGWGLMFQKIQLIWLNNEVTLLFSSLLSSVQMVLFIFNIVIQSISDKTVFLTPSNGFTLSSGTAITSSLALKEGGRAGGKHLVASGWRWRGRPVAHPNNLYTRHCTFLGPQQYTRQMWSRSDYQKILLIPMGKFLSAFDPS